MSSVKIQLPSRNRPKSRKMTIKPKIKQQNAARNSVVVSAPVAKTQVTRTPAPKIHRSSMNGDVVVEHEEFLADISGSTAFTNNVFPVNPGLYQSFPWLSQMARLFESYKFESLEYQFKTEAATTAIGSVMAAIDYDASDAPPVSKQQLATYRGYARSSPWNNFNQRSLKEDLSKRKTYYVRTAGLTANQDPQLFDTGLFIISTERQADTSVVGELYVKYRVRLMTPQLSNPALGSALSYRSSFTTTTATTMAGSNAPLTSSGNCSAATPMVLTASAPYNGLVVWVGRGDGPVTFDFSPSTATVQNVQSSTTTGAATLQQWSAQVAFLPGQTLSLACSAACTAAGYQVGQFDVATL